MDEFQRAIGGSDVVFIVGTGLSAFTSDRAPTATWTGLIQSGARRARQLNPQIDDKWQELVDKLIEFGTAQTTIQAGGLVATSLRDLGEQAFADWLKEDIGSLAPKNERAVQALLSYPFPILTTNYDTLIERVSGREARDWTDASGFQEVVTRSSEAIGHLHGVWTNPSSIVLTETDYARIRQHESTQALERAISALKSLVYVGFGSGLSDPNFSELLAWHKTTFPESRVTHYRLCRASELDLLQQIHAGTNVQPISYGEKYEDLSTFLEFHSPDRTDLTINEAGLALDIFNQTRQEMLQSITQDSVLIDAGVGDVTSDLTIPPVLLPVAHANYVRERLRREKQSEVARVDPIEEVKSHDFFVVVGDEGSGLTTAIKWLTAHASDFLGTAAPLFVRFSDCRHRRRPLGVAIRRAAQNSGLIRDQQEALPAYVLAIDNLNPNVRVTDTVLAEAVSGEAIITVIGCQQGGEDELVSKLRGLGKTPRVLYMGRLRRSDISQLAEKLAPGRGAQLAEEVVKVLDAEGLRRTPLSVALLLFLILQGNPHEVRNQTSILDAYASLLIKLGDPHTDTTRLTELDLQAILSNLAEYMIWEERSSLPEAEAERVIADVLQKYAWPAQARDVLNVLLERRLLRNHQGSIEFARYTYFTLFAAKRATTDKEFRDLIVNDLFYYEPVAVKLAALTRTDEDLLERLSPLLTEAMTERVDQGSPYEVVPIIEISELPPATEAPSDGIAATPIHSDEDEIEFPDPGSTGSFGLVRSEMQVTARLHRILRLASSILRDLDQVEQIAVKQEALVNTLELWGRFIAALSADENLVELRKAVAENLQSENVEVGEGDKEQFLEFLVRSIPAGTALAGMEGTLLSPKLESILDQAFRAGNLASPPERLTGALFFYYLQRPTGWVDKVRSLLQAGSDTWIITHFFHALCQDLYAQGEGPEDDIMDLCKELALKGRTFTDANVRGDYLNRYAQKLRTGRARSKQAALAAPDASD